MKKTKLLMSCILMSCSILVCSSCSSNITTDSEPGKIFFYNVDGTVHFDDKSTKAYFICDLSNSRVICPINTFITSVYDKNNADLGYFRDETIKIHIAEGKNMIGGLAYYAKENSDYFDFSFVVMRLQFKD